eukprot:TRINITY_DN67350_c0_g1_i1.p1 TRINITY_DN67350_c0_g1~~TRINITY_DN67350_c0_g1_i1.p1  ORF type:complete len:591 (-),score=55.93 TRINITY_DN67350_c0_g1_i1:84-1634(-)
MHRTRLHVKGRIKRMLPNMKLVVERYVKPWTRPYDQAGLALVLNAGHLAAKIGRTVERLCMAEVFISHCWNELFAEFCGTLSRTLELDTVVWICSFSIWQHGDIGGALYDVETCPFAVVVRDAKRVIAFTDSSVEVFQRSWCILEAKVAQQFGKSYCISLSNNDDEHLWHKVAQRIQKLDVKDCQASEEADRQAILAYASAQKGGIQALNDAVRTFSQMALKCSQIMAAARVGDTDLLLAQDADELREWRSPARKETLIHILARQSQVQTMVQVLDIIGDSLLASEDEYGNTPLNVASASGALAGVKTLVAMRAALETPNHNSLTALHLAASNGHPSIVALLLEAKADLQASGEYRGVQGYTSLSIACRENHIAVVRALLAYKAPVETTIFGNNISVLSLAAYYGSAELVGMLIASKAKVNSTSNNAGLWQHVTPLMFAAKSGSLATVGILLAARADGSAVDPSGRTYWDYSYKTDSEAASEMLGILGQRRSNLRTRSEGALSLLFANRCLSCTLQ